LSACEGWWPACRALVGWWGVVAWFPACLGCPWMRASWVGVGLLFEIWIVDASIKIFVVVSSVHHQPGVPAAVSCV
jgi:hypothetical protein